MKKKKFFKRFLRVSIQTIRYIHHLCKLNIQIPVKQKNIKPLLQTKLSQNSIFPNVTSKTPFKKCNKFIIFPKTMISLKFPVLGSIDI